jgi:hypothetical protein
MFRAPQSLRLESDKMDRAKQLHPNVLGAITLWGSGAWPRTVVGETLLRLNLRLKSEQKDGSAGPTRRFGVVDANKAFRGHPSAGHAPLRDFDVTSSATMYDSLASAGHGSRIMQLAHS